LNWSDAITKILWYGSITLETALCARLLLGRFALRFPWFTAFVAALAAESLVLALIRPYSAFIYGEVWSVSRGLALTFEVLAVIEIFSLWSRNFPGIETFGRKLFLGLLIAAAISAAATLPADATRGGWVFAYQMTAVVNREVHLLLATFLALMTGFFARFGGLVDPNLRRHTKLMLWFEVLTGVCYLATTVAREFWLGSMLVPGATFVCLAGWLFAFRRGENTRPDMDVSPEEMAEYEAAEALSQKLLRLRDRIKLRKLLGLKEKVKRPGPVVRPKLRERH
jgi:hypothetical protein